jgi:pimeloyl-ACP methyl ester carboxylesterase
LKKNRTPVLLQLVQWVYPRLEKTFPSLAHRFFITIFFSPLNYAVPEKERVIEKQSDKFILHIGGRKSQCYSWGRKEDPTVLLVHGWAGRATQFRKIIPALLQEGYRVVGFDGPAHGKSDGRSTSIMEFEAALRGIYETIGTPEGVIAHSFGGGAVLYAAMNGLPVKKLINIASPTIGDEIIGTYLKTINGSSSSANFFKSWILKTTGKAFDEFTAMHFVQRLPQPVKLLLVHDDDDAEVSLAHALALQKVYPQAGLYKTSGLGHTRILRDEGVIKECVSFLKS